MGQRYTDIAYQTQTQTLNGIDVSTYGVVTSGRGFGFYMGTSW